MFVTYSSNLQGQFRAPESVRMLWNSADISQCEYSFLVEGVGLEDGAIGPVAHVVSDVATLQMMRAGEQGNFLIVSNVHIILSPAKSKKGSYAMELLSEIRIQGGTESSPVYEFITKAGEVYTSTPS